MASYVAARPGDDLEMELVNGLLRQQAQDCIAALEIMRTHGYTHGLASGKLARRIMEHFDVYVARCTTCAVYQASSEFKEWPKVGFPTYVTRLSCKACTRTRINLQSSRQCRSYTVSFGLWGGSTVSCTFAARSKNEAAKFFFTPTRGFDPEFLDLGAESYKGTLYTVTLCKQSVPGTIPIACPDAIVAL